MRRHGIPLGRLEHVFDASQPQMNHFGLVHAECLSQATLGQLFQASESGGGGRLPGTALCCVFGYGDAAFFPDTLGRQGISGVVGISLPAGSRQS